MLQPRFHVDVPLRTRAVLHLICAWESPHAHPVSASARLLRRLAHGRFGRFLAYADAPFTRLFPGIADQQLPSDPPVIAIELHLETLAITRLHALDDFLDLQFVRAHLADRFAAETH